MATLGTSLPSAPIQHAQPLSDSRRITDINRGPSETLYMQLHSPEADR